MPTADNLRSIAKCRHNSAGYDASAGPTWPIRMRCIALLALRSGDTGRVIAFEQRPEMHAQARVRADILTAQGWRVDLQCASAEVVVLAARPEASLWHHVHDITRTPAALDNLFAQLPAGSRLAVAGMKFFPWWLAPLNLLAWLRNRPYNVHAHQLDQPWSLLAQRVDGFRWEPTQAGMGYIGAGIVSGHAAGDPR